jgi:hypothetical protein
LVTALGRFPGDKVGECRYCHRPFEAKIMGGITGSQDIVDGLNRLHEHEKQCLRSRYVEVEDSEDFEDSDGKSQQEKDEEFLRDI